MDLIIIEGYKKKEIKLVGRLHKVILSAFFYKKMSGQESAELLKLEDADWVITVRKRKESDKFDS